MPKEYFKDHTTQLVKPWPNTYTYSKCMAERTLLKTRGNVPVLIVRPSIIIAAYQEPLPGWIDAVAAAVPLTSMIC
jgi:fatty acyl-CoA reductase